MISKLVSAFLLKIFLITSGVAQDSRFVLFNDNWRFHLGDGSNFEKPNTDDQNWEVKNLPHDWSIEQPFSNQWASGTGFLPGGVGWYRKTFLTSPDDLKKISYIYFDGVYKNSEVWINGHYLGKRPNGFASFYYDLTEHLVEGVNVIAVKVDHSSFADSRWYTGSGINRNVYMVQVPPVHVGIWGRRFHVEQKGDQRVNGIVRVTIENRSGRKQIATVKNQLLYRGSVVAVSTTRSNIAAQASSEIGSTFEIKNPYLWSPENPELYSLLTMVSLDGKVVDQLSEEVGVRFFSFDVNKGFSLNGKSMKLKGVCIHDDAGSFGSAVPADVWKRRLKMLKEMGCNAIRMSHNPHQDYLYTLCDQLGFLVQDEAFDEWEHGKNKWIEGWNVGTPGKDGTSQHFIEWGKIDLADMIRRNYNHPSIIMWSIGNEIDYPNDPYTSEILNTGRNPQIYGKGFQSGNPPASELGKIAKELVGVVKGLDVTRPVTAALAGVVMSNETEYPRVLDVVGYNYQEYRYLDDHKAYPERVIYGSENGKGLQEWKAVEDNDFISGQFLWTGFDFLGEAGRWPTRGSGAGLIDLAGFPKSQYYHRRALWSEKPSVHAAVSKINNNLRAGERPDQPEAHWNWRNGDSLNVACFSNADSVELLLNGKRMGTAATGRTQGRMCNFKIKYEPGVLEVKGISRAKVEAEFVMKTTQAPIKLVIHPQQHHVSPHADSVAHVVVQVVDANGLVVPTAEIEIELLVEGPGVLAGLESGSLISREDYQSNRRYTFRGQLMSYIKATGPGTLKVQARSAWLQHSQPITIVVK